MNLILFIIFTVFIVVHQLVVRRGAKDLLLKQSKVFGGAPVLSEGSPKVQGTVSRGFEPVKRSFQHIFDKQREVGAQVAVYYKGELVVDLWAGEAVPNLRPWASGSCRAREWFLHRYARLMFEKAKYFAISADPIQTKLKVILGDCKSGSQGFCTVKEEVRACLLRSNELRKCLE